MTDNVSNESLAVSAPAPAVSMPAEEKMLPQHMVNKIVGSAKDEAYEKGKRDALEALQAQQQPAAPVQQAPSLGMGGMNQMTPDGIRQMIVEQQQQLLQQQQKQMHDEAANKLLNDFNSKLQAGKEKYPDFDEKLGNIRNSLHQFPHVIMMANASDATPDVMYELANNPKKLIDLETMARVTPDAAPAEMQKLIASIKQNQAAATATKPADPLSQINPSPTKTDSGTRTIRDFKSQPWLMK
jgi:hypothetical protein